MIKRLKPKHRPRKTYCHFNWFDNDTDEFMVCNEISYGYERCMKHKKGGE